MTSNDPSEVEIDLATSEDVDAIAEHWVALARDQRAHGSHVLPEANRETMRETLSAHRFTDSLLVARLDGAVIAFASFSIERGSLALEATRGFLSNLYVAPVYRGNGIGERLLREVERTLAERGADVVALETMAENEAARRFYRRAGYDPHRIAMARPLADSPAEVKNDTHSKEDG